MQISKKKAQIFFGTLLLLFFVFTVDFRVSIFRSVYVAYAVVLIALFLIFKGADVKLVGKLPGLVALWMISIIWVLTTGNVSYIIKYALGVFLLYCFSQRKEAGLYLVQGLGIVGLIFSVATFVFYFFPDIYLNSVVPYLEDYLKSTAVIMMRTNRYPGLTGHYSTNGTYVAIGFGAIISTILCGNGKEEKGIRHYVACLLVVGALLLIGKRAHLVFSIAAAFCVYWLYNDKAKTNRLLKVVGIVIIVAIVFIIMVNKNLALSNTFNRFYETAAFGDFLMSRGKFYAEAFAQFKKHIFWGCGWKQMMKLLEHDVHNIYIQLLAETGVIGFSFYVFLFVSGLNMAVKLIKGVSHTEVINVQDRKLLVFASYYMFFFILYGFTGNPLYDQQPFYLLMISYGLLTYYAGRG